jgi:eukaryotic-like serine/threonine-protein kinase
VRERLAREGALPVGDAVRILRDVVDALTEAHAHGVVHRDIKPENIMLRGRHALVTDFGVAKAVSEATGRQTLTTAGVALGTPAYMAPEQASADPHLDHRVDLYAVGAVGYELLTGRPVFMGTTPQMVLAAHVTEIPVPLTKYRETVPRALEALVMRCLEKRPADRWQSAAELLAQLEALLTPSGGSTPTQTAPLTGVPARRRRVVTVAAAAAVVVVVAAMVLFLGRFALSRPEGPRHPGTAIAVLPFENLSGEGPNAYFAGGLHDELLTQLAKVTALKVIGRTSVLTYEASAKRLSEIGDELAVGSIVEGSVQVLGDRLRVNVQLIDPATEAHVWAESYDRMLDDAFAVQSEIARQIVAAVGAALGATEQEAIAQAPTTNAEAYRLYLQGLEYRRRPGALRRNLEIAQDFYERAIALDSMFALAHAELSDVHHYISWFRYDPSPERLVRQREEAELALRLAPDLPQAHLAMGTVCYARGDWPAALQEFRIALAGLPNDAELWVRVGYVHRRLGNWDEVLAALDRAVSLDPRNADAFQDLGGITHSFLHRYQESVAWFSRSLALAPDVAGTDVYRGRTWVLWEGRLDSLAAALDRHVPEVDLGDLGSVSAQRARLLYWDRKPDSLLALLRRTPQQVFEGTDFYLPTALYAAWAHQLRGEDVAARAAFDSARVLLDSVVAVLAADARVHAARGLAYAGLGRHAEAQRETRWLERSRTYREDAFDGPQLAEDRARILAEIGEPDAALAEIERLLAGPSWLSVHVLRLDPRFDPIRGDARFQALLVQDASPGVGRR